MSSERGFREKITSIKNTQKITQATEMIAATKIRQAQQRMDASKPYANYIADVISHLATSHSEYTHPFMIERPVKRVGMLVVGSEKGLCGGLNANLFRLVAKSLVQEEQENRQTDLGLIGRKATTFFGRNRSVIASIDQLGSQPKASDLIGVIKVMLDAYSDEKIDQLIVAFNRFESTMIQRPTLMPLLPMPKSKERKLDHHWDYLYEPDPRDLLNELLHRYIETEIYQAVIENAACEQAAKMIAMRNATDNAGALIDELQLAYNKARQAAITTELTEIVAGAEAL